MRVDKCRIDPCMISMLTVGSLLTLTIGLISHRIIHEWMNPGLEELWNAMCDMRILSGPEKFMDAGLFHLEFGLVHSGGTNVRW